MSKDVETALLIIEDLLRDYEIAVKEAERWWGEYKTRKRDCKNADRDKTDLASGG